MRVNLAKLRKQATEEIMPIVSGVYFLFDGDELVYVGESRDVYFRVRHHYRDPEKPFTRWTFIELSAEERVVAERKLIRRYKPRLNRAFVNPPQPRPERIPVPVRPRRTEFTKQQLEEMWFPEPGEEERQNAADRFGDFLRGPELCAQNMHTHDPTIPSETA
jgi:hypothetical protein